MNEVIASILDAEERAEEIIKLSSEKSALIRKSADEEAEKIKNGAVALFKLHRNSAIKDAENRALDEYNAIMESGKNEAEKIKTAASDKLDALADNIVKGIIG